MFITNICTKRNPKENVLIYFARTNQFSYESSAIHEGTHRYRDLVLNTSISFRPEGSSSSSTWWERERRNLPLNQVEEEEDDDEKLFVKSLLRQTSFAQLSFSFPLPPNILQVVRQLTNMSWILAAFLPLFVNVCLCSRVSVFTTTSDSVVKVASDRSFFFSPSNRPARLSVFLLPIPSLATFSFGEASSRSVALHHRSWCAFSCDRVQTDRQTSARNDDQFV